MEAAIICAFVFYFVYRVLESLIHRKERLIVAQKLETLDPQKNGQMDLNRWFGAVATNKYAPLRWGFLLAGAALGLLVAFFIKDEMMPDRTWYNDDVQVLYFSSAFLFAGIGLLISFGLERKYAAEDRKKE